MADEHYDTIVIGTSQGGRFLPIELAKAGQKVALVERGQLGGVCVNRGVATVGWSGCSRHKSVLASKVGRCRYRTECRQGGAGWGGCR